MECYTYPRNIQDLLSDGETPYERRFEEPVKGPIIPFGSLVEYYSISARDQSRIHQFGKKVFYGLFLGYALYAWRIWKGDIMVADNEELETLDASEIYSKRLNAKEVIFPKQNGKIFFPAADGRIKFVGGDGQGDGVPKAGLQQAAADSRGFRTCVSANTYPTGLAPAVEKDELTSCRGSVLSAWQKPPVRRKGGRAGLPQKGKWPPRGKGRQSSPILEVRRGNRQGW